MEAFGLRIGRVVRFYNGAGVMLNVAYSRQKC